jgi:hypothetical protein
MKPNLKPFHTVAVMYGGWVNTAHIVYVDPPDQIGDGCVQVHLTNGSQQWVRQVDLDLAVGYRRPDLTSKGVGDV